MFIIDKDGARKKGQSTVPMSCTKITGMKMNGELWPSVVFVSFCNAKDRVKGLLKAKWIFYS